MIFLHLNDVLNLPVHLLLWARRGKGAVKSLLRSVLQLKFLPKPCMLAEGGYFIEYVALKGLN